MGEHLESKGVPRPRTNCLYCGVELGSVPSPVQGLCVACSGRVLSRANSAVSAQGGSSNSYSTNGARGSPVASRSSAALAELIAKGPTSETPRMVGELVGAGKTLMSLAALIPLIGPWLIQQSEVHSTTEKRFLSLVSVCITVLGFAAFLFFLPEGNVDSEVLARVERDLNALGAVAEQYRAEHGAYPDSATWLRFTKQGQPHFYDPWGRPYGYAQSADGSITITTLGSDGLVGGEADASDASTQLRPAN
jgi:type II secretion system (T2SS) protein G